MGSQSANARSLRKELGKISAARFGWGGYQDAQIGLSLTFTMKGSGVGTFIGHWGSASTERCRWTEAERRDALADVVIKIADMLTKVRGKDVHDLIGTPVELTFEGNTLHDWRLLEEVL